tara:strand:- start:217 stop:402 length:186 start_codon:yes stop_codon:yes gene_type:complete
MSDNQLEYLRLFKLLNNKSDDDPSGDEIRDRMDDYWNDMSEEEQDAVAEIVSNIDEEAGDP